MSELPAGFVPDQHQAMPAGFVPDNEADVRRAKLKEKAAGYGRAADKAAEEDLPTSVPGMVGRAALDSLGRAASTFWGGAKAAGSAIAHPIDTVRSPEKRREFERGVDDMVTLGVGQKLADKFIRSVRDPRAEHDYEEIGPSFANTEGSDAAKAPGFRPLGNMVGLAAPGGAKAIAKGGAKVAEKAIGPGMGMMSNILRGGARGAAAYEVAAPAISAAQAGARGENPLAAAAETATDPAGPLLAATAGAGGGAGRGAAQRIRDPKTMSGRTVQAVEAAGGRIKPFGEPTAGGEFESPELQSLPEGRAGQNQLAGQSEKRIVAHNRSKLSQARAEYGNAADQILAEHGERHHVITGTHELLAKLEAENTINGVTGDDKLAGAVSKVRRMLTSEGMVLDDTGQRYSQDPFRAPAVKVEDLIKVKKLVNNLADWKDRPTAENRPYRMIAKAIDADAATIDPRIGEMNAAYKQALAPLEESNDILFGKRKPDIVVTKAKAKSAALKLGRVGDDTQAATTDADQLAQLRSLDPAYARELQLLEAKKATERLRYGEPEVSTSIEKGMRRGSAHGTAGLGLGALGLHFGGIPGALLGYLGGKVAENAPQAKVRIGLPVAEAAGRGSMNPFMAATLAAARKKKGN